LKARAALTIDRLTWRRASLCRRTATPIRSASISSKVRSRCSSSTTRPSGERSEPAEAFCWAHGVKHAVRNPSENAADIVLVTNNRFASFLAEAGRRAAPGAVFSAPSPEDIQRVRRVSEAYGYWNASPAESAAVTG
jgi:hypothetical protein